jgi:hypothetical protein
MAAQLPKRIAQLVRLFVLDGVGTGDLATPADTCPDIAESVANSG